MILVFGKNGQVAKELDILDNILTIDRSQVDLRNRDSCAEAIEKYKPEAVINAAAYTAVDKAQKCENDAYKIDFSIVNEKGKRSLITGEGEYKNLKEFFKAAYRNVHNFSTLSRFSSEDPKNLIHKLQDGYIYICLF